MASDKAQSKLQLKDRIYSTHDTHEVKVREGNRSSCYFTDGTSVYSLRKAKCPNNPASLYLGDNEEVFPFHSPLLDLLLDCIPYFIFILVEIGTVKEAVACINSTLCHLFHLSWRSLKANTTKPWALPWPSATAHCCYSSAQSSFPPADGLSCHLYLNWVSTFQANSIFVGKWDRAERN